MKRISVKVTTARDTVKFTPDKKSGLSDDVNFRPGRQLRKELFPKVTKGPKDTGGEIIFEGLGITFKPSVEFRRAVQLKAGETLKVDKTEEGHIVFENEMGVRFKPSRALRNAVFMKQGDVVEVKKAKDGKIVFTGENGIGFRPSKALKQAVFGQPAE